MQKQPYQRQSSDAKAVALDLRKKFARYRLYILISLLSCAGLGLALQILFHH